MTKKEIKTATNEDVIVDYILSHSRLCCNINMGRGTKQLEKHTLDLEAELFARGILSEESIKKLNM